MNKPYWGLWSLLLTALIFFVVLSFWQDGIRIGNFELKTASFTTDLGAPMKHHKSAQKGDAATDEKSAENTPAKDWRAPLDTTAKNILFIGDSMLEGLAPRLAKYCDKNGHTLVEVIWYSRN